MTRVVERRPAHGSRRFGRADGVAVLGVLVLALSGLALLVVPGRTITTIYVNDLLIFLDGAHRILSGQVPNRDFHTALGPLVFYVPAAGLALTGNMGSAMPIAAAIHSGLILPGVLQIVSTRLPPPLAFAAGAFLTVLLLMPANPGDGLAAISFAMFHNRIGWVAFAALLILHLEPDRPHRLQRAADAAASATLALVTIYTKASYAALLPALFLFLLWRPDTRRIALHAAAVVLPVMGIVELFWRGSWAHVQDLLLAASVSGGPRDAADMVGALLRNLPDHVLFVAAAGLAVRRTRRPDDLVFFLFCAAAGFLLIRQNFQSWGIFTLHGGIVVAAAKLLRPAPDRPPLRGAEFIVVAALLPTTIHGLAALGLHAGFATARPGEDLGLPRFDRLHLARTWTNEQLHSEYSRYAETLRDGVAALHAADPIPDRVFVLDFVTPFSAGLGLRPPRGDSAWQHWGRNFDETHHEPPEDLLRDVRLVMHPKWPVEEGTSRGLADVYSAYLERNFMIAAETQWWTVRKRLEPDDDLIADRDMDAASLQPSGQTSIVSGTPSTTTRTDSGRPSRQ